jgi:hypothetical protein
MSETMTIQPHDKPFVPASNICSRCAEPLIPNDLEWLCLQWNQTDFIYCPRCAARMQPKGAKA